MLQYIKKKILFEGTACPWWLAFTFDNRFRKLFHDPEKMLKPYVKSGMTVLDLGCGLGYFSIAMAGFVGNKGKVISLDIQEKMLTVMKKRAEKAGVLPRIVPHLAGQKELGLKQKVDFALSFWMVHEIPDREGFLKQVFSVLKKGGHYLIAEPRLETGEKYFQELLGLCEKTGFKIQGRPEVSLSRAVLLMK